jgi:hypothetical protein
LKTELIGAGCGFISLIFFEVLLYKRSMSAMMDFSGALIADLFAYISLSYCYFHFINLGETARRIRIMRELYDSPEGLSIDGLSERYNAKMIIEYRLSRLISNGQLVVRENRYYIGSPIVLLISKIILAMKKLLTGKGSEFD